jgi:3'(2'), 5'-bisphosphate nucleotidase
MTADRIDYLALARSLIPVVIAAGELELTYFKTNLNVMGKKDGSPVTLADQEAEKLIQTALTKLCPDIPMVGEENVAAGIIPDISEGTFFLVDALDGTKEFISGGGEFTVNIALLDNNIPVMGIIYVPVTGEIYFGAEGQAFMRMPNNPEEKITVRAVPAEGLTVVSSKRRGNSDQLTEFLKGKKVSEIFYRSSSLKFCAVASRLADIYPQLGPTSEWDTAAGQAIVAAAGGRVTAMDGTALVYGKVAQKFLNPTFIASSKLF